MVQGPFCYKAQGNHSFFFPFLFFLAPPAMNQLQPNSFELAEQFLKFAKKKLGTPFANPFQNFWYFDTVVKNYASTLVKPGVGGV